MARTNRKRRRKHRGTQAGTVEARGRTSRPQTPRKASPATARERRAERLNRPPTWRGSIARALIAAVFFGIFVALVSKRNKPVAGLILALLVFFFYLPLTYYFDRYMYRRRQRRRAGG